MKIYNNPSCSKCIATLALLKEKNHSPEIINYLETPPSVEELKNILQLLNISPLDLIRKKESIFKDKFAEKKLSDQEWMEAMIKYPVLIERPIFINGDKAIIGRPPVKVLEIL